MKMEEKSKKKRKLNTMIKAKMEVNLMEMDSWMEILNLVSGNGLNLWLKVCLPVLEEGILLHSQEQQ